MIDGQKDGVGEKLVDVLEIAKRFEWANGQKGEIVLGTMKKVGGWEGFVLGGQGESDGVCKYYLVGKTGVTFKLGETGHKEKTRNFGYKWNDDGFYNVFDGRSVDSGLILKDSYNQVVVPKSKEEAMIRGLNGEIIAEDDQLDEMVFNLLGLRFNSYTDRENLINRMREDREIIRQRCGLPPLLERFNNPREYMKKLEKLSNKTGVLLRPRQEYGAFFEKHQGDNDGGPQGVFEGEINSIFSGFDEFHEDIGGLRRSVMETEHELIHAFQQKFYPGMPRQVREYQAYLATEATNGVLKYFPERVFVGVLRSVKVAREEGGEK